MTTTNERGHSVPESTNSVDIEAIVTTFAKSINDVIHVASTADRATKIAALSFTPSTSRMVLVARADATAGVYLELYDGTTYYPIDARFSTLQTSGVFTAATGWTVDSQNVIIRGGVVFAYVSCTRTGGNLTIPSDGNVTNDQIATVASGYRPLFNYAPMQTPYTGPVRQAAVDTAGGLYLTAVDSGSTVNTSATVELAGSWPLA